MMAQENQLICSPGDRIISAEIQIEISLDEREEYFIIHYRVSSVIFLSYLKA